MFMLGFFTHWPLTGLSQGMVWSLISFPGAWSTTFPFKQRFGRDNFPSGRILSNNTASCASERRAHRVSTAVGMPVSSQPSSYAWRSRKLCCWTLPCVKRSQKWGSWGLSSSTRHFPHICFQVMPFIHLLQPCHSVAALRCAHSR